MRNFGLIGKTLKHSFSEKYFANKFNQEEITDAQYSLFELHDIREFPELISGTELRGLNVTIPYKEAIIPYLDELDDAAKAIGAVNTIDFKEGITKGYNTDNVGFKIALKKLIGRKKVNNALILGTGGASKAIQYSLSEIGINYSVISRTKADFVYEELDKEIIRSHRLIVNCTPLGTYPAIEFSPVIPYEFLTAKHLLFDLVYNPEKTLFLAHGESVGASIMNGYEMLVQQAEASWEIWNTI